MRKRREKKTGKTAGIIIIGDEILTGKVREDNAFFMTRELWMRGIPVSRISVIPDLVDEISSEVRDFANRYDYVFTSGGIGPTHDDVTIEGIARAFGVRKVVHEEMERILSVKIGALTAAQLRMAEVPEGADILGVEDLSLPVIRFRNVFILPGIPQLLRQKFMVIEKLFQGIPISIRRLYLRENESKLAPLLSEVAAKYPSVKIGSYPVMENSEYNVMVTLESVEPEALGRSFDDLVGVLDARKIFKVQDE
jgi:molybdenum cofactor synthesis domain-containing protein